MVILWNSYNETDITTIFYTSARCLQGYRFFLIDRLGRNETNVPHLLPRLLNFWLKVDVIAVCNSLIRPLIHVKT